VFIDVERKKSSTESGNILNIFSGGSRRASEMFRSSTMDNAHSPNASSEYQPSPNTSAHGNSWGKSGVSAMRSAALTSQTSNVTDSTEDTESTGGSYNNSSDAQLTRSVSESVRPTSYRAAPTSSSTAVMSSRDAALTQNVISRFKMGKGLTSATNIGLAAAGGSIGVGMARFMAAVHQVLKVKKYVPYVVIKQGGVVVRSKPAKDNTSGNKMIGCNERINVYARRKDAAGINWLKCKEGGWIQETNTPNGDKHLVPVSQVRQPVGAEVVSTRFVEVVVQKSTRGGWFSSSSKETNAASSSTQPNPFSIRFVIEILGPDDTKYKIHRSYTEIMSVRKALLSPANADKSIIARVTKLPFPSNVDGDPELLCYTSYMVDFVETVGNWLRDVVRFVNVDRCKIKEYKTFITPNEEDFNALEVDLCAQGGMGGAFEEEMNGNGNGTTSTVNAAAATA
jgi:hypothetical protein